MTGTAATEADEFAEIYKLEVVEIPTNVAVARLDSDDEVYKSAREKYDAVITLIDEARTKGQPVLVGTTSIEKSELIAALLKAKKEAAEAKQAVEEEKAERMKQQAPGVVLTYGKPFLPPGTYTGSKVLIEADYDLGKWYSMLNASQVFRVLPILSTSFYAYPTI